MYFTVLVKETGLLKARLGLAISNKHARRAVDRNRLKRLVRESFRIHKEFLPGIDVVVLAKRETYRATNPVLKNSLADLWKSVHRKFSLTEDS